MSYYPIFLDLTNRPVVVIGGGPVAEGKVEGLLAAGARVTVVAPDLTPALQALAAEGRLTHHPRPYAPGDLAGASLVISATDDRAVNAQVYAGATAANLWVNVVDDVPHCTFIAPSVLRQGDLTVAISTSGLAPVLAVRLREQLEQQLGPEYARFLQLAARLRQPLAQRVPDFEQRRRLWYQLVDSDILPALRRGDEPAALGLVAAITGLSLPARQQ
jgi:siroheme synthase-like protein